MPEKPPRTIAQLAQEALDCQDGCNPLGLSKGYARALQELRERLTLLGECSDTDAIIRHPINKLWASKMHSLAGMGLSDLAAFSVAYSDVHDLAKGGR